VRRSAAMRRPAIEARRKRHHRNVTRQAEALAGSISTEARVVHMLGRDRELEGAMSALHEAYPKLTCGGAILTAALLMAAMCSTAAAVQGECTVNRATFRSEANSQTTNSQSFVNISQAELDITVGGSDPTCVIVVFSAQTQTASNENMGVRARIPGIGNGEPAEISFGPGTGAVEARTAQFVFEEVPPGNHTVRMQFRSSINGTSVTISRPTVVVHHR
jgi:hypothetical protein